MEINTVAGKTSRRWRGAPEIRFPHRYGRRYAKNQIALNLLRHINELNKRHDTEEVDVETFAAFVKSHPALLQPAFSMQQTLRERILGGAWWDRRSHERVKVNGMNLRIHDLMKAHLHEGAFHAFMKAVGNCVEIKYQAPTPSTHNLTHCLTST